MAKPLCSVCGKEPVAFRGMSVCGTCENIQENEPTFIIEQKVLRDSEAVRCFTTSTPANLIIKQEVGLVFGTSSKQAFWGLSTQADRLTRAYDAALGNLRYDAAKLGANGVVGVSFALNNSAGSTQNLLAGSSEAVMLLGTAVIFK